eukprot:TRINITY_DN9899_c0_g1_i1.p1 TRINITY_DN9899_c0_g1~~TRINITY_DN9899_c0_g1_i1.p1  ORF type:complete len:374 (+),score=133.03 TRINITY_DN9899_c0_g1_i1:67-1188(+)
MEALARMMKKMSVDAPKPENQLDSFDLQGIASHIIDKDARNIVVMTGAGISVAAGIPDFRSPGTGLYDNLSKYDLPYPEAIFTLDFFRDRPEAFFTLAKELWPGNFMPTPAHYFLKALHDEGRLLRCYTQNIDGLEIVAGLPKDRVVAAHGSFSDAHCIECGKSHDPEFVKKHVETATVPRCGCGGVVKPDIVFFGESLPERFSRMITKDFPRCDLLVVAGTSLSVHPFAGLVMHPEDLTPRLVINNEQVGTNLGLVFEGEEQYRDVHVGGDLQEAFLDLASKIGIRAAVDTAVAEGETRFKPVAPAAAPAEAEAPGASASTDAAAAPAETGTPTGAAGGSAEGGAPSGRTDTAEAVVVPEGKEKGVPGESSL